MKVAVLVKPRTLEIQERPVPEPGAGEVRVKLGAVGVCGSDVHYYQDGRIGDQVVQYPFVIGHEPAGVVDAVGAGVRLQPGARIAVEPALPCWRCECCRSGRPNICHQVKFLGTPPVEGVFAQYRLLPEECCLPISDKLSLTEAALLEPLGVGLHAVRLAALRQGETVAIFGSGPIGLVTMLSLRAAGAGKVLMTDLVPARLALAMELGADAVLNAGEGGVLEWILEMTGGRGVDVAFEAAGQAETIMQACRAVCPGGRLYLIGSPVEAEVAIPIHEVRRKELLIQNVRRSNREVDECLDLVASGRLHIRPLATHFFPLEEIAAAFALVQDYADGVIRAIIQPNQDLAADD